MRFTEKQLQALLKKSKYRNKKTVVGSIKFDSKKESVRYKDLLLLIKVGAIVNLELQKEYKLIVNGQKIASYFADFVYRDIETGETITEDVKSEATRKLPVYRLKKKLMQACHNITITEV